MSQTPPKSLTTIPECLIKGNDFVEQPKANGVDTTSPVKKGKHFTV